MIRIVDVFSGAGGLSLGWKRASPRRVDFVAAVDNDRLLQEVFRINHPGTFFLPYTFGESENAREMASLCKNLGLQTGDVDVLLAGPPCQPFSAAGKRRLDEEGMLVFQVINLATYLRPRLILIENVPEFARVHDGRLLGRVRVALKNAGYWTDVRVLRADCFGVPQARQRCFVLAVRSDVKAPPRPLFDLVHASHRILSPNAARLSGQASFLAPLLAPVTVKDAIGDLPSLGAGEGDQEAQLSQPPETDYQAALRDIDGRLFNHVAVSHSAPMVAAIRQLGIGETPQRYDSHPLRPKEYFRAAYARLDPDKPAPTITTQTHNPGSGRFTHYQDDRVITVREAARLQGFPDSFQFIGSQEAQRRHVGNAVPPLLSQALAQSLISLLI